MFCDKCGSLLPDRAKFCPECGMPVDQTRPRTDRREIRTVQFRCKSCGNVMEIDPDSPILRCSACGSNELILEGDDVTVERIKSNAYKDVELGRQQVYKEVELGKRELEIKETRSRFIWHIVSYIIIIAGAICSYWGFNNVNPVGLLVGVIVLIAGIVSTGFSKKAVKEERRRQPETVSRNEHHATKEDIELAKVRAEERTDKIETIVGAIVLAAVVGALVVMTLLNKR